MTVNKGNKNNLNNNHMTFRFYSNPENSTVRVSLAGTHENGVLKIAAARCSNRDNFQRKKGRQIAEGRLHKDKVCYQEQRETCTGHDFVEVARSLAAEITNNANKVVSN